MRRIRLTRHARNRMRWHGLTEDAVERAVQEPDWVESSQSGRVNRWKRHGDRFLRVTCNDEPDLTVVITAVLKRRAPEGGKRE